MAREASGTFDFDSCPDLGLVSPFLGTPDKDKEHVIYDAGHGDLPRPKRVRESLDWLDKYLGPVRRN